jgi:hypothetical protein
MNDTKVVVDGAIATGAITLPWWAVHLNEWAGLGITVCGLVLVIFRIALAYREWKNKG